PRRAARVPGRDGPRGAPAPVRTQPPGGPPRSGPRAPADAWARRRRAGHHHGRSAAPGLEDDVTGRPYEVNEVNEERGTPAGLTSFTSFTSYLLAHGDQEAAP